MTLNITVDKDNIRNDNHQYAEPGIVVDVVEVDLVDVTKIQSLKTILIKGVVEILKTVQDGGMKILEGIADEAVEIRGTVCCWLIRRAKTR